MDFVLQPCMVSAELNLSIKLTILSTGPIVFVLLSYTVTLPFLLIRLITIAFFMDSLAFLMRSLSFLERSRFRRPSHGLINMCMQVYNMPRQSLQHHSLMRLGHCSKEDGWLYIARPKCPHGTQYQVQDIYWLYFAVPKQITQKDHVSLL